MEELTPALAPHSTAAWTGFDEDCIEPSDDLFEEYQQEESMDGTFFGNAPVVADSSPASKPFIGWRLEPTVIERQVR